MSLFGAFWDKDPNPVGQEQFGNNRGLFFNLQWYPKGVLHIGAWDAWEAKQYAEFCGNNAVFIEAHPESYLRFKGEIEKYGQKFYNYAAWNVDDLELNIYSPPANPDSSSVIEQPGNISKTQSITVTTLFEREKLDFKNYDLLNIDTEGAELQVLEGIGNNITNFTYIIIEVSDLGTEFEKLIDDYMTKFGFYLVRESTRHVSTVNGKLFCDKLYKKRDD